MSTGTIERALQLLGAGVNADSTAAALGVTPSYISQLLADEDFATKVAQLRYETLSKHSERDAHYDSLEDKLLAKLDKSLGLLIRPQDILRAVTIINGAKRRGQDAPDSLVNKQQIVQISMPIQLVQKFTTNIDNQVVKAGEQELLTMQSSTLLKKVESKKLPTPETKPEEENKVLASL